MIHEEYKECIVCSKPLGQESRDLEYRTCHDHRTCIKDCGELLNPHDIKLCHKRALESEESLVLIHPRCQVLERRIESSENLQASSASDPILSIRQSEYDFLNSLRLMCVPNVELSDTTNENNASGQNKKLIAGMNFEQKMIHLKMMEACVASCSIVLRTTKEYRKEAFKEREERQKKQAEKQKLTSSRPTGKSIESQEEILLGTFMEIHGLSERKTAQKIMKDTWKAIEGLVKIGIPEKMARENIVKDLVKKGILKK